MDYISGLRCVSTDGSSAQRDNNAEIYVKNYFMIMPDFPEVGCIWDKGSTSWTIFPL